MIIVLALVLFGLSFLAIILWLSVAIEKTIMQRCLILDFINGKTFDGRGHNKKEFHDEFDSVSFDKHYFHVATFRKPEKLYPLIFNKQGKNI